MKTKVLIKESELIGAIKMLVESQLDLSDYDDMDLYDMFISIFRKWLQEKFPNQYENYPLSFLAKKHVKEFLIEHNIDWQQFKGYYDDDYIRLDGYRLRDIVTQLFQSGKYTLPRVGTGKKITEKYKKAFDFYLNNLELPSYATLKISEDMPNKIRIDLNFDFVNFIKAEGKIPDRHRTQTELENFLSNALGLQIGEPVHGDVEVRVNGPYYFGQEEWVKNVLNKEIKKKIREIPGADKLHSIKYRMGYNMPEIKIAMKSNASWNASSILKDKIKELLKDMGYHHIRVER